MSEMMLRKALKALTLAASPNRTVLIPLARQVIGRLRCFADRSDLAADDVLAELKRVGAIELVPKGVIICQYGD